MALICFISQKGSPGATTTALAVAAAWPPIEGRRKLFAEADPFGGVLALRYQLGVEPGLLTLAAAVRAGIDSDDVWDHAQTLPGGMPAIIGPDRPDQVSAALTATSQLLGSVLTNMDGVDVIADVGRVSANSPTTELLDEADLVLMVARPEAEQLQPAAQRLLSLGLASDRVGWVLIGDRPHHATEVEATFGVPVAGVLADDRRGAAALARGAAPGTLRRSALARTASALASSIADHIGAGSVQDGPPVAPAGDVQATPLAVAGGRHHER